MANGVLIESLYYEIGLRADQLKSEGAAVVAVEDRMTAAAVRSESALAALTARLASTPDGARALRQALVDLTGSTDHVIVGMTRAGAQAGQLDQALRAAAQREAEAALAAQALVRPIDQVAARMGFAASGAARWEEGLRRLQAQQQQQLQAAARVREASAAAAVGLGAVEGAGYGAARGADKIRGALVGLATSATGSNAQVSQLVTGLLLFGAGSGVVTAIAAGIAIIAGAYDQLTRAAKESRQETKDLIRDLFADSREGRLLALREERQKVTAEVARLQAELDQNTRSVAVLGPKFGLSPEDLEDLKRRLREAQIALRTFQEQNALELPDLETTAPSPEQVRRRVAERFAGILPATVDATADAIHRLSLELKAAGASPEELAKALDPLIAHLETLQARTEDLSLVEAITGAESAASAAATLERLDALAADLVGQIATEQEGTARIVVLRERLARVNEAIVRTNQRIGVLQDDQAQGAEDLTIAAEATAEATRLTAEELVRIARGAIGVAQAFGLASDNAAAMLQNVVTVGESLPDLVKQINLIGKTKDGKSLFDAGTFAASLTGVLGGLAGLASGLLGESADDKRDREIRERNTKAIRDLTKSIEDQVSGRTVSQARAGVDVLLGAGAGGLGKPGAKGGAPFFLDLDAVTDLLKPLGLSLRDLKDLLKSIDPDLTLNTSSTEDFIESLKQMRKALAEVDFRAFAETFAGQLDLLQARANLLDLTNPADQLKELQKLAAGKFGTPALNDALKGLDLTTQAGRDAAEKKLLELFDRLGLSAEEGGLTDQELGGLSSQELRDLILQFEGLIDAINEREGTGSTTGGGPRQETFGEFRGLTEVRGSALQGTLISIDSHVLEGTGVQREIRDLLASVFGGATPISAPPIPVLGAPLGSGSAAPGVGGAGGAALVVTVAALHVHVEGGRADLSPATAGSLGREVAEAAARELYAAIGQAVRHREITIGRTVVET